jgi:hypothetical protein
MLTTAIEEVFAAEMSPEIVNFGDDFASQKDRASSSAPTPAGRLP